VEEEQDRWKDGMKGANKTTNLAREEKEKETHGRKGVRMKGRLEGRN